MRKQSRKPRPTWATTVKESAAEGLRDLRAYLKSFIDPEDRARVMLADGLEGDPDLEDIAVGAASPYGGENQRILAALREPPKPTPKKALRLMERSRKAHPKAYGERREEKPPAIVEAGGVDNEIVTSEGPAENCDVPTTPATMVPVSQMLIPKPQFRLPPSDSLTEGISRHLYENQAKIWPHIKEPTIPRPPGYQPRQATTAGHEPVQPTKKTRSSDLMGRDAVKLYNAIAFAMWRDEAVMTVHLIILWHTLGVYDHARATGIFSDYLNQAGKWAKVGKEGESRERRRNRTGYGFDFRYVYVHENGTGRGFHTHVLCTVPRIVAKDFERWSMQALRGLACHKGDGRTLFVVTAKGWKPEANVARCWHWFRYLMKQLNSKDGWGPKNGPHQPLRETLQPWPYRKSLPVTCAQLTGTSHDIGEKAQKEAGFISRLMHGDLADIYAGHELEDGRVQREMAKIIPTLNL